MTKKLLTYFTAFMICAIHLIPFFLLLNVALKTMRDTSSRWTTPDYVYLQNFLDVWEQARLGQAIVNNLIITASGVALVVFVGMLAAYPLSRFPTRWNNFIYTLSIAILIVPALTVLVPLYKFVVDIHGINSYWAIVLIHTTFFLPTVIFLYTGFIRTIPRELDEAALIDGCSRYSIFFRIIFPLLKPVTASVIIMTMLGIWNDYRFSLFFLQKRAFQTVPLVLSQFFSQFQNNLPLAAAGSILSMIPMTLVFIFLQKYFISGLAEGAVKG
ncbi:MAG: carbohydrate ABC transporter permease [Chloroflexota bacterium]|nr:MAG: carbohydrate ABC transporter permease [Chloroflexota bacterium]